jgi:toxic protein SymE
MKVSVMAKANSKSGARLTQNPTCQERKIKVNQIHYMRKLKDDLIGAGRPVPWIQLKGHWLQQAGFEINTPVKVRVMNGCLVLTTTDEPGGS